MDPIATQVATIPLQLLAHAIAVLKDTDVDQPRNLAKSVTVEWRASPNRAGFRRLPAGRPDSRRADPSQRASPRASA